MQKIITILQKNGPNRVISNRTKEHTKWTISTSKENIFNSIIYQASMMNFVEAMDQTRKAFQYLKQKFPYKSESKMK